MHTVSNLNVGESKAVSVGNPRIDLTLETYRKRLHFSAILLAACLAVLVCAVGGQEFFDLAKASFEKPVCCIHHTRNPFDSRH